MKKIKILAISILLLSSLILSTIYINNNPINSNTRKSNDRNLNSADSSYNGGGYNMSTEALFSWEEINVSGDLLDISAESHGVQEINFSDAGWSFTFYNTVYNKVYVRSDGWMTFTEFSVSGFWHIPQIQFTDYDFVALLMCSQSLDPSKGGNIYYEFLTSPNRLVLEYSGIYNEMSELVGDFEVIFYESGNIKFQYKIVFDVFDQPPVIGLDHGDSLNYNSYIADLPMQTKAIEFTFDQMIELNYGLNFKESEEYSWIVTNIDDDKLESFFGSNWEEEFGFLPDPLIGDKMKINISTIYENIMDWQINFDMWNWINRFEIFTSSSGSDDLIYKKDPYTYDLHNLTNIIPLLLPNQTFLYLIRANLTSSYNVYDPSMGGGYELSWHMSKTINGDYLDMSINALYTFDGIMDNMQIRFYNQTSGEQKTVFKLETLTSLFLEPSSMSTQLNDEHWFYVRDTNDTIMQTHFGSDWEQLFGIPSNSFSNSKFKIEITLNNENTTHWLRNYSLWDCIDRDESFTLPPSSTNSTVYLKEPFNYTAPHMWDPIIPLFLPSPARMYIEYSNLDPSFYQEVYNAPALYPPVITFNIDGLEGRAVYSNEGYLRELSIQEREFDHMTGEMKVTPALRIYHFSEGPIPSYVGISPGETYSYGIYNCSKIYPYPTNYKRMNVTIDYISGEDSYLESVLVLANFSFLRDDDIWVDDIDPYDAVSAPFRDINYIYPNSSKYIFLSLLALNSLPLFFEIGVNWSDIVAAIEEIYSTITYPTSYNISIVNLTNGFEMSVSYPPYAPQIDEKFTYTSEGILEIVSLLTDENEFFTVRLNDFDYVIEGCDIYDPIITINSPVYNSLYGHQPPTVDLSIEEDYLDTVWYNLDDGTTKTNNYTYIGSISQSVWDQVGNGTITVTFYVNDTNGNMDSSEVILRKDVVDPEVKINKPTVGANFNTTAPDYDIEITESNLDTVWYTLNDGINNIIVTSNTGIIDEDLWNALVDGPVTITFYANDTAGNIGSDIVIVYKESPSPTPEIPGFNPILLIIITLLGIVGISWICKKKLN